MIAVLYLPSALRAKIEHEARVAFPNECCGLIEGARDGETVDAVALHPAKNLSNEVDRFEINPADHFAALRAGRENGRAIIGCYHSHPNGNPEPSERDRAGAIDEGFIWLVCGVRAEVTQIGAFIFENGGFRALKLLESASA